MSRRFHTVPFAGAIALLVPRGPLAPRHPHHDAHGRVAASLLLYKIHLRCSVYIQTPQRTVPFFLPFSFSPSLFLFPFVLSSCSASFPQTANITLEPASLLLANRTFDSTLRVDTYRSLACYSFYPKFLLLLLSSATESNGFKILAPIVCISLSDSDFTCSAWHTRDNLISFVAIGTSNENRRRLDYICINRIYVHVHLYICIHTRLLRT